MNIYLDACCFNRPFDDQNQERVRLETIAIIFIFNRIDNGLFKLMTSDALELEILKNPDERKKRFTVNLLKKTNNHVFLNNNMHKRANELEKIGFKAFDSLHIAISEMSDVQT